MTIYSLKIVLIQGDLILINSSFDKLDQMKNLRFFEGLITENPELYILINRTKEDLEDTINFMIEIIIELSKRNSD